MTGSRRTTTDKKKYNNARGFILRNLNKYGVMEAIEEAYYKYELSDELLKDIIPRIRFAVCCEPEKFDDKVNAILNDNGSNLMKNDEIFSIITGA